jgi:hypothetical protein
MDLLEPEAVRPRTWEMLIHKATLEILDSSRLQAKSETGQKFILTGISIFSQELL